MLATRKEKKRIYGGGQGPPSKEGLQRCVEGLGGTQRGFRNVRGPKLGLSRRKREPGN